MSNLLLSIALMLFGGQAASPCKSDALIIDDHAEGVSYRGCWQVEYTVREPYPANQVLSRLTTRLQSGGWLKLDYDPFNPEVRESAAHKWTEFQAQTETPTRVDQWIGWFKDADGNRLQLAMNYYGRPPEDKSARHVIVKVTFVTPEEWERRPK